MQIHEINQHNTKFWVADDVYADFSVAWFDQVQSEKNSSHSGWNSGRQAITRFTVLDMSMVLRHYYRGGLPARLTKDKFVFNGFQNCRSYQEMTLLNTMQQANLPVPKPIAAKCVRNGMFYSADLLMREIENTKTLAEILSQTSLEEDLWIKIGHTIRQFHQYGIQHVDLNANNILIDSDKNVYLIDFDRCKQQPYFMQWAERGLKRLERSLEKEKSKFHDMHYEKSMFLMLRQGYGA